MIPKHKHYKSEEYLKTVRMNPCLICESPASDAHHMRGAEPKGFSGMGLKRSGDEWAVPLCRNHHVESHMHGDERTWWDLKGIDSIEWAKNHFKNWRDHQ